MQMHIVAVPANRISAAMSCFKSAVAAYSLTFREIDAGIEVDEAVAQMDNGPYDEYFCITLPTEVATYRKFVCVHERRSGKKFPMNFGTEVRDSYQ